MLELTIEVNSRDFESLTLCQLQCWWHIIIFRTHFYVSSRDLGQFLQFCISPQENGHVFGGEGGGELNIRYLTFFGASGTYTKSDFRKTKLGQHQAWPQQWPRQCPPVWGQHRMLYFIFQRTDNYSNVLGCDELDHTPLDCGNY